MPICAPGREQKCSFEVRSTAKIIVIRTMTMTAHEQGKWSGKNDQVYAWKNVGFFLNLVELGERCTHRDQAIGGSCFDITASKKWTGSGRK